MKRQAGLLGRLSLVLAVMLVLVAGGAAQARTAPVGSHDSRARAEFRAPITATVTTRVADRDKPFMCRDKAPAAEDWD